MEMVRLGLTNLQLLAYCKESWGTSMTSVAETMTRCMLK